MTKGRFALTILIFKQRLTLALRVGVNLYLMLGMVGAVGSDRHIKALNRLDSKGNYSAMSSNTKLVRWPLLG